MDTKTVREKIANVRENIAAAEKETKILQWHAQKDWDGFGGDLFAVYNSEKESSRTKVFGGVRSKSTIQLIAGVGRMGETLCDYLEEAIERVDNVQTVLRKVKGLVKREEYAELRELLGVEDGS